MRNALQVTAVFLLTTLASFNVAWARNPWVSAIGEACVVQHRAEDIANRIKRTAPGNHLVQHAMSLDHLACALVERVKCSAPCNQVEGLYQQLQGCWSQLRVAIYTDPCLCSDRTLKSLADGMDTRMRNLCRAIERVVEKEFRCVPSVVYHEVPSFGSSYSSPSFGSASFGSPYYGSSGYGSSGYSSSSSLHMQFQSSSRIPFGVPSNSIQFGVPTYSYRVSPYQSPSFSRPEFDHPGHSSPRPPVPGWNPPAWPSHGSGGYGQGGTGAWRAF